MRRCDYELESLIGLGNSSQEKDKGPRWRLVYRVFSIYIIKFMCLLLIIVLVVAICLFVHCEMITE